MFMWCSITYLYYFVFKIVYVTYSVRAFTKIYSVLNNFPERSAGTLKVSCGYSPGLRYWGWKQHSYSLTWDYKLLTERFSDLTENSLLKKLRNVQNYLTMVIA